MLIGVPREIASGERRVALVPEVVPQLSRAVHRVVMEQDAGLRAIAEMVHDIDMKDGKFNRDETPGFQRLIDGIAKRATRDEARLERGAELLNDFYESVRPSLPAQSPQS